MKILSIQLRNLASIESASINFRTEPLASAGIFAITGPTGAGKSTILDALCLALYAQTPRYVKAEGSIVVKDVQGSTISQNDVRGILRDGATEGAAEVEFVGVDGQQYCAKWSVRRAYNRATGNLQPFDISLKNVSTNTTIPGRKTEILTEIERAVGLNFDQFTRSVLLAQGDFTAFLKASKDDKSSLLEKLTGTNIYSLISQRIFEKHREEAQLLHDLNIQRAGIQTLTLEELESLRLQKGEVEAKIQVQEKVISDFAKELIWHEQLIKLRSSTESAQTHYNDAISIKERADPRARQLNQVVQVQQIRSVINSRDIFQKQIIEKRQLANSADEEIKGLDKQKEELHSLMRDAEESLGANLKEEEEAQPLLIAARTLDAQLIDKREHVSIAEREAKKAAERHQQQNELFKQHSLEADGLKQQIEQLTKWKSDNTTRQAIAEHFSLIDAKLKDAATLLNVINDIAIQTEATESALVKSKLTKGSQDAELNRLQKLLTEIQGEYDKQQEALSLIPIESLEQDKLITDSSIEDIVAAEAQWKLLWTTLKEKDTVLDCLNRNRLELEDELKKLQVIVKQLEVSQTQRSTSLGILERAKLAVAENIEDLRLNLVPEEPCPVCGSKAHPYASESVKLNHILAELEANHQQIEDAYTICLTEHGGLVKGCEQLRKSIELLQADFATTETSIKTLESEWSAFEVAEACMLQPTDLRGDWLKVQLQEKRNRQGILRSQIQTYGTLRTQIEIRKEQIDLVRQQLTDISDDVKDTNRQLTSLEEQLKFQYGEKEKAVVGLTDVRQSIGDYFDSDQWFENWKVQPEHFLQQISSFARQWKANENQLEEKRDQVEKLGEEK